MYTTIDRYRATHNLYDRAERNISDQLWKLKIDMEMDIEIEIEMEIDKSCGA